MNYFSSSKIFFFIKNSIFTIFWLCQKAVKVFSSRVTSSYYPSWTTLLQWSHMQWFRGGHRLKRNSILKLKFCPFIYRDGYTKKEMVSSSKKQRFSSKKQGKEGVSQQNICYLKKKKRGKEYFSIIHSLVRNLFVLCFPVWWKSLLVSAVKSLICEKLSRHWQSGFYPPAF